MQIKYQALSGLLQKSLTAIYVLTGLDNYLLNDAAQMIKSAWFARGETDSKILYLNSPSDWSDLADEANSYSLFSEQILIDARLDKKSIEKAGKDVLDQYLKQINPHCILILRAPNVPAKQLLWLTANQSVVHVQIYPLTASQLQQFISTELQKQSLHFEPTVPNLIFQYTEGNMLAAAQMVEKLALTTTPNEQITEALVKEQLIDQCQFQLYELTDACLLADLGKSIHLLRQASENRSEASLVLWILVQEIRQLIQLTHLLSRSETLSNACSKLKIWPQRVRLYQAAVNRLSLNNLYTLLRASRVIDEQIKTSNGSQVWIEIERLILKFCSVTK